MIIKPGDNQVLRPVKIDIPKAFQNINQNFTALDGILKGITSKLKALEERLEKLETND